MNWKEEKAKKFKPQCDPSKFKRIINRETYKTHDELYTNYVEEYNDGDRSDFIKGGVQLHGLYFEQLRARNHRNKPRGRMAEFFDQKFGGFDKFKKEFIEKAMELQGSGWCYLNSHGTINIIEEHAEVENCAVIVDLWEHAYVQTYGSNKEKYLKQIWDIIDWEVVEQRIFADNDAALMRSYVQIFNS